MVTCDHCKKEIRPEHHCIDDGRDFHTACLKHTTVHWLIMDYVSVCNKQGRMLEFKEFIELWMAANAIAIQEIPNPEDEPRPPLPFAPRSRQ
jgi:hypothetical protein